MRRHTIDAEVLGPWSLRTSRAFWEGFSPAALYDQRAGDGIRTVFRVEADWSRAEAQVTQRDNLASISLPGDGDPQAAADQVLRFLSLDFDARGGVDRPKVGKRLPRYVDKPAEFAQVIAAAATPDPGARDPWVERDLALAGLLAGTAARAGEVCALTLGDLMLGGEEPHVRVIGKGSVTRDCPLSPELVGVLGSYRVSRQARIGTPARKKDPVFLNTRLAPLSTAALDHSVRRWFTRAGVPLPPGAAAHAFRYTVAMQLIELGESATVVQDLLGHASLSSTQVFYTKAAGRHVRAAANALPVRHLLHPLPDR